MQRGTISLGELRSNIRPDLRKILRERRDTNHDWRLIWRTHTLFNFSKPIPRLGVNVPRATELIHRGALGTNCRGIPAQLHEDLLFSGQTDHRSRFRVDQLDRERNPGRRKNRRDSLRQSSDAVRRAE